MVDLWDLVLAMSASTEIKKMLTKRTYFRNKSEVFLNVVSLSIAACLIFLVFLILLTLYRTLF